MKNKDRKLLEARLLKGVEKAISDQHAVLTKKTEKAVQKILKQIAKKASKEAAGLPPIKNPDLNSIKSRATTVARMPATKKKRTQ